MKKLFALGLLVAVSPCFSQADPGCQFANTLLGALGGRNLGSLPCKTAETPTPAAPNRPAAASQPLFSTLYNPQNVQRIVQAVRDKLGRLDPLSTETLEVPSCEAEMASTPAAYKPAVYGSFRNDIYGYDLLQRECESQTAAEFAEFRRKLRNADHQRFLARKAAEERAQAALEAKQRERAAADEQVAIAELRSGKRKPENCQSFMIAKGMDPAKLKSQVMAVAYKAPTGLGEFVGVVTQMDADGMLLSGNIPARFRLAFSPPPSAFLLTGKSTMVFEPERIQVGAVVYGYATQSGTRNGVTVSGQGSTVAVMQSFCIQPPL